MNRVILMGRTTRDPEVRYGGANNTAVARFTLAVDRRFKRDGEESGADFISCVAFNKTAEFMEKYGRKGTKFVIEGQIRTGSYTNKDGQKVYTTDVVCDSVEFAESKSSQGGSSFNGNAGGFTPSSDAGDGFMNIPDGIEEELPFN